ncbi:hypothetical protein MPLA_1350026 [Mesorhizobium sp. ORS 3359]|nr:hypothetical protein MPLA_1350026 [Mesorhizobium sp. ORS 3359]
MLKQQDSNAVLQRYLAPATPLACSTQRRPSLRNSVNDSGSMSIFQTEESGAPSTCTMAARIGTAWVSAMVWPRSPASRSISAAPRRATAVSDSPPWGAASGSANQAPMPPGSSACTSSKLLPAQRAKSCSASSGSTVASRPSASAVLRAASAGLVQTRSARRNDDASAPALSKALGSGASSVGKRPFRAACVAPLAIIVRRANIPKLRGPVKFRPGEPRWPLHVVDRRTKC